VLLDLRRASTQSVRPVGGLLAGMRRFVRVRRDLKAADLPAPTVE
jgi:hypothetical protein